VGEDDCSHVGVVHLQSRSVVEQAFREDPSRSDSNGGQRDSFCNVAKCIHTRLSGVLVLVSGDKTTPRIDLDSCVFEAKTIGCGWSSNGLQDFVSIDKGPILHGDSKPSVRKLLDFLMGRVQKHLHSRVSHLS